jgi:PAS domain S-box-containing protein
MAALLTHLSATVLVLAPETYRLLELNPPAERLLGPVQDPASSESRSLLDHLPGWALARALTEAIPAATDTGVWSGELALIGLGDREIHVSATLLAQRDAAGEPTGWVLLAEDLSKERKERAEIGQSDELFRVIAQNAADIVALFDTSGHSLYDSASCKPLLGYGPGQLSERWIWEKTHTDDKDSIMGAFLDATASSEARSIEVRLSHQDGTWRTFEIHFGGLHGAGGEVEKVMLAGHDITERKTMELQMRQGQKLEAIGQLAAGIAHEINSPTQFIGDNTRFLRDGFADLNRLVALFRQLRTGLPGTAPADESLAEIDRTIQEIDLDYLLEEIPKAVNQSLDGLGRVSKIVQAMKDFSHPGVAEKIPIDLNRAVESTITVAGHEWKYVAEMTMAFAPDLPPVPCLPGELNQVILNLIVNAAHAIGDRVGQQPGQKGTITVSTHRLESWAEIRIQDTGTGIPVHIQNRIFDPFFTTKEVGRGTGQGLSISRSVIVDKHCGTLAFETEPGVGTTFIIRLPLALSN